MGQSVTVATGFTAFMLIGGLVILITSSISAFTTLETAITEKTENYEVIINEKIEITSFIKDNSTNLRLNVTNTGETSIMIRSLRKMDLIASFTESGSLNTSWIEYDNSASGADYWFINRVFFHGEEGDLINPIDIQSEYGLWDPDECLELMIRVADSNGFQYISLSTSNGVKASSSLTYDEQWGSVVLPSTEITVWVSHDLDRLPINIQITPANDPKRYWVSNWNSTHFMIEMDKARDYDVLFFWHIH